MPARELQACVIDLFEHILCSHIRGHLDQRGILTPFNHGFRGRHTCESELLVTTHDILQRVDRGEQVDVAILDFSKAFDTVPHHRLLHKLQFCGVDGDIHLWVKNFLTTRTQSVLIDGDCSREDPVESGIPQGTVLGPLLFLIYISDLPSVLHPNTAVRLFADDCLIYRSIHNTQEQVKLQHDLDALELWGRNWGMKFNTAKCNMMRMGRVRLSYLYQLNKNILAEVTQAKYLGLRLSSDLNWEPHISSITSEAHQRLGFVRRNLCGSPHKCCETAYISLVRSQLEYCCTIWDPTLQKHQSALERIQRQAAWWTRSQYGTVSVTGLLWDLGWKDLANQCRDQRLILLYKIINGHLAIPPDEVNTKKTQRKSRKDDHLLERSRASHRSSPLWPSTIFRTIPKWNQLPATVAGDDTVASFKGRLAALSP